MDGRTRTLPGAMPIPGLAKNLISIRKMDDARVKMAFEKVTYIMVQGAMVLLKGVRIGTMYKLQGRNISNGCNSSIVLDIGEE
jgi:hypothetical protein